MDQDASRAHIDRRRFLGLVGAAGATGVVVSLTSGALVSPASAKTKRWSDRSTWGGRIPRKGDVAVIKSPVLLDTNASVAGVVIKRGGKLIFAPRKRVTLRSTGNVIVRGKLVMRPAREKFVHKLVFAGIKERRFKGGGMGPVASDVGLWVMGRGRLDIAGAPKTAWTRLTGGASAGESIIKLQDATGWRVGDEIAISPSESEKVPNHWKHDEVRVITRKDGGHITLDRPLDHPHPLVTIGDETLTAEVANLARNCVIAGTPKGRAHIFISNTVPVKQKINHVAIRHMGPRKNGEKILGRWPLHFHHSHHNNRGTVVKGVVARDTGSHAYVPHFAHGVTIKNCIAYNVLETPFWWDNNDTTNDALWINDLVLRVRKAEPGAGLGPVWGYTLRKGTGNAMRNCVVAGVYQKDGSQHSGGFNWPSAVNSGPEFWQFDGGVAHNCSDMGSFSWQVEDKKNKGTPVNDLVVYSCEKQGILHGSYGNGYQYNDCKVLGGAVPVAVTAKSNGDPQQAWRNLIVDAGGADHCVVLTSRPVKSGPHSTLMIDAKLSGHKVAAVTTTTHEQGHGWLFDFVRCLSNGNDLEPSDFHKMAALPPGSLIRVQRRDGTAYQIDHTGLPLPIPPFYG